MKVLLWSSFIAVAALCAMFIVKYTILSLRVAFATDQVALFEEMKASANVTLDPQKLSGKLDYVVNYYPSGSKQVTGTQLDKIVEAARANAIATIIARMRTSTGKDLGDDAEKWLMEYQLKTEK